MSVGSVDLAALRAFSVFQPLTPADAADLAERSRPITLWAGDVLFRQGDPGDSLYLVVSGQIEVRADGEGVSGHRLATIERGGILGEVALLVDVSRTATAIAVTDAELWGIDRKSCQEGIDTGQRWANLLVYAIARGLAERLSAVNGQLLRMIGSLDDRDDAREAAKTKVAELELLRARLMTEWTF